MKTIALISLFAILTGCSSMGSGSMNTSSAPMANSSDNVRF